MVTVLSLLRLLICSPSYEGDFRRRSQWTACFLLSFTDQVWLGKQPTHLLEMTCSFVFLPNSCLQHLHLWEFHAEDTHFLSFFLLLTHCCGLTSFSPEGQSAKPSLSLLSLSGRWSTPKAQRQHSQYLSPQDPTQRRDRARGTAKRIHWLGDDIAADK